MLLLDEQLRIYVSSCRMLHTFSSAYPDHHGYQAEKKKQIEK